MADIIVVVASVLEEMVVVVPELIFVEAVTVTGPATVPLFKITVALPLTVEPVAVASVSSAAKVRRRKCTSRAPIRLSKQ